jgi:predicted AlkP superfamily pyrophosphatase or phosphodiesterase
LNKAHVRRIAVAAALGALIVSASPAALADPPKLAVILVVDQMRADYVDRFQESWTGGLKRMVSDGAWFSEAAYPYLTTVTCAGHATIATGSFPHRHGIFQNNWWDRELKKQVICNEDPRVKDVAYGAAARSGDSAYRLQVPTLADVMRSQRKARVVSLALKDRSAIMLAGHGGDAVTWLSNNVDGWITSPVYTEEPVPAVKAFLDANPMTADLGKVWTKLLPDSAYPGSDDAAGEAPPRGWTRVFPHQVNGTNSVADETFLSQWQRSPFADAYVGRFAASLVKALKLGTHDGTDVLAVSFSTPDMVGHAFGPRSHEVMDIFAHLDRTIGTLFDELDAQVGKGRWVAGLSADHGVTPIPEQLVAEGKDAGRISGGAIIDAVNQALSPTLGPGRHVTTLSTNDLYFDLYFEPGVYDKVRRSPPAISAAIAAIAARPGVQRVFRSEDVRDAAGSKDPLQRAAALSYFPGRSGDLIIATKPGWMISAAGTTHGSANPDDQRVPLLFLGQGVKPGKYARPATPADLAPTLAAIVGVSLKAEGHPLF